MQITMLQECKIAEFKITRNNLKAQVWLVLMTSGLETEQAHLKGKGK